MSPHLLYNYQLEGRESDRKKSLIKVARAGGGTRQEIKKNINKTLKNYAFCCQVKLNKPRKRKKGLAFLKMVENKCVFVNIFLFLIQNCLNGCCGCWSQVLAAFSNVEYSFRIFPVLMIKYLV